MKSTGQDNYVHEENNVIIAVNMSSKKAWMIMIE